ncbi:CopG family ribbon-helix-helix protein [Pseudoxanthomonas wuyuanensis]
MSTTTIRLPEELKARVAKAAERAGTTPHGFMLEAIAARTEAQEHRDEFHSESDRRWRQFLSDGLTVEWNEMREYLLRRSRNEPAEPPVAKSFGSKR